MLRAIFLPIADLFPWDAGFSIPARKLLFLTCTGLKEKIKDVSDKTKLPELVFENEKWSWHWLGCKPIRRYSNG